MDSTASIGIVGAGAITRGVHLPVLKNLPAARIAWVADVNEAAAREVAKLFRVPHASVARQLLSLPPCDIALLAVPVHARDAYLQHFAGAGTAVVAEKPFAVTASQHLAFTSLFGDVPISCGYMRRSYANVRALRRMIRGRWFGALRSIKYCEGGRTTRTEGGSTTLDLSHALGGGVLRDVGCHGVDTLGFISGATDFTVHECRIEWDGETDRHVAARFSLSGVNDGDAECMVDYRISWLLEQPNTIELQFERAAVRAGLKPEAKLAIAGRADFSDAISIELDEPGARTSYQAFFLQWDAILAALRAGGVSEFAASTSLWTTRLVEALYAAGGAR